jgi:hypothetical protein
MSIASEPDPHSGSPVGVKADATPARRPGPMVLEGRFGRVEKLDAGRHGAAPMTSTSGKRRGSVERNMFGGRRLPKWVKG